MDQYPAGAPATYDQPQCHEQPLEYHQPPMCDQPSGYGYPGEPNVVTTQGNLSYVKHQPPMCDQPSGYGNSGQPNAVTTQGNLIYISPNAVIVTSSVRPPSGMVMAILACIFCFFPTGLCAIMYASQANSELDTYVAWSKYRTSRILSIISIIVGLIWITTAFWRIVY